MDIIDLIECTISRVRAWNARRQDRVCMMCQCHSRQLASHEKSVLCLFSGEHMSYDGTCDDWCEWCEFPVGIHHAYVVYEVPHEEGHWLPGHVRVLAHGRAGIVCTPCLASDWERRMGHTELFPTWEAAREEAARRINKRIEQCEREIEAYMAMITSIQDMEEPA